MESLTSELKNKFIHGGIVIQLIYVNTAVFILIALIGVVTRLFNTQITGLLTNLALPATLTRLSHRPWTIITYMFTHTRFLHLLFNMLWLYWFGNLFIKIFSSTHLKGLYVFGGICGGVLYILSYWVFPMFASQQHYSILIGASASVLAIVAATAYKEPELKIRLFILGTISLKYLALAVIVLDVLSITSNNPGGHIAHLGGAGAGLLFAYSISRGTDLTAWINRVINAFTGLFAYRGVKKRTKLKAHYQKGVRDREQDYEYNARKNAQWENIDTILDKLKKSGYQSLTPEEKKSLFDAGKR